MENFKYELSDNIKCFISNSNVKEISIGCSDSQVFKVSKNNDVYFIKTAKEGMLTREYEALKWLEGKLVVPKIVIYEIYNGSEFLVTEEIKGNMVFETETVEQGIRIIVDAFKEIYKVDYKDCPFNVSLDYKLNLVKENVGNGLIDYNNLSENVKEKFKSLDEIISYLEENRFEEDLCFSHGDTSLPNIFYDDGKFSGFIDVGECGIADKWFDLAICQKSIKRNYGQEAISLFYNELGIEPDNKKIDYYLLMMELYL